MFTSYSIISIILLLIQCSLKKMLRAKFVICERVVSASRNKSRGFCVAANGVERPYVTHSIVNIQWMGAFELRAINSISEGCHSIIWHNQCFYCVCKLRMVCKCTRMYATNDRKQMLGVIVMLNLTTFMWSLVKSQHSQSFPWFLFMKYCEYVRILGESYGNQTNETHSKRHKGP